jgi:hypothetical protein
MAVPRRLGRRHVIIHYHIYKNAGMSVDAGLRESFREAWVSFDSPSGRLGQPNAQELLVFLAEHKPILALSSHTARLPAPSTKRLQAHPIIFLRHPIDRVGSIYAFMKRTGNPRAADKTFSEWVDMMLGSSARDRNLAIQSYQTLFLSDDFQSTERDHGPVIGVTYAHFAQAIARMHQLPVFGLVERFEESVARMSRHLRRRFPELTLQARRVNSSDDRAVAMADRLRDIEAALGSQRYARLVGANEADLELYNHASSLFDAGAPARSR